MAVTKQGVMFSLHTPAGGLQDVVDVLSHCSALSEGRLHKGAGSDMPVHHGSDR